jgi:hypothetical protein
MGRDFLYEVDRAPGTRLEAIYLLYTPYLRFYLTHRARFPALGRLGPRCLEGFITWSGHLSGALLHAEK